MKTRNIPLFSNSDGGELFSFLIVISPPHDIITYANELKTEFFKKNGAYDGRHSKPHITICSFPLLEERQEKVFSTMHKCLEEIDPFILELNGFGSFKHSNVIFLNVVRSEGLNSLIEKFREIKMTLRLGKKFTLVEKSHLIIAKKLKPGIFESARLTYLPREYQNSFIVDRLKMLRYDFYARRYFDVGDLKLGGL